MGASEWRFRNKQEVVSLGIITSSNGLLQPRFVQSLIVRSILHLSNDIISLTEEGEPFIKHGLLLVIQVIPIGDAVFGLERRTGESTRGVFSSEHWRKGVSIITQTGVAHRSRTMILAAGAVGGILGHVEDNALDGHQRRAAWIRACNSSPHS